jgi:insertion element IS1 protein InsB
VNPALMSAGDGSPPAVVIRKVQEAELHEMWSFVGSKKHPRWLWEALEHQPGRIVAYVFGRRADRGLLKLKALLAPFGIRRFSTDGWGAYQRHLDPPRHVVGKRRTQQLERKHLTLRTRIKRLVRRTVCFSKSVQMHEVVSGLFINRFEFGVNGVSALFLQIHTLTKRASDGEILTRRFQRSFTKAFSATNGE